MKSIKEFERRVAQSVLAREAAARPFHDRRADLDDMDDLDQVPGRTAMAWAVPEPAVPGRGYGRGTVLADDDAFADYPGGSADEASATEDRTSQLINHGRRSAYHPGLVRRHKVAFGAAATTLALLITLATVLVSGGASWPASVTTMQPEITTACQNPDVASEPGQVNFACAKGTQQILWVFALLASSGNPQFNDPKTGRVGLEPIAPAQGAEVAWSLNLHHPYDPVNPIDSLEVAARAINNIIGGASVIGANGSPSVQPGLESYAANCVRYTGSAAITSRQGFPSVCASTVTTPAQQAALVEDVYKKWAVGATSQAAQNAALLFENAGNPGNPEVQVILMHLSQSNL
jgi:hypothetical protein